MCNQVRTRLGTITRSATGPSALEASILIAIATIPITRLYLQTTRYPQVGAPARREIIDPDTIPSY